MDFFNPTLIPVFDVILRVPPLFIIDALCDDGLKDRILLNDKIQMNSEQIIVIYCLFIITVSSLCLVIMILPTKHLLNFYVLFTMAGTFYISYFCNSTIIKDLHKPSEQIHQPFLLRTFWSMANRLTCLDKCVSNVLAALFTQALITRFYCRLKQNFLNNNKVYSIIPQPNDTNSFKIYLLFISPIILSSFSFSDEFLNFASLVCVVLFLIDLKMIFEIISLHFMAFRLSFPTRVLLLMRDENLIGFLEHQWTKIHASLVLKIFCFIQNFAVLFVHSSFLFLSDPLWFSLEVENPQQVWQEMLSKSTSTYVSILCMASVLHSVAQKVGKVCSKVIGTSREEDQNMGKMVAILFLLLAFQTGLPLLNETKRLLRLYYNFSLTFVASLHYIHSMVHFKLQSVALTTFSKFHVKQLFLNFSIFSLAAWFIIYHWTTNPLSTWLLSVCGFGCELLFNIMLSVLLYAFIFIDSRLTMFKTRSDTYIYYLTFTGKFIAFLFGVFLFCNGVWMVLFESAGVIRVVIMCAHLYFNIWKEAKELYSTCSKRKETSSKITSLISPSPSRLSNYNDLCAICFQELDEASSKETKCQHIFHDVCLCKWVIVSETCPICHRSPFHSTN